MKQKNKLLDVKKSHDIHRIIKHPLATEKSVRLLQDQNKLHFVVDKKSTKSEIKHAVETLFKVKVIDVKTHNTAKGNKIAYVRLTNEYPAIDIATDLGLM